MVNKLILGTANFGMNYGIAFGKQVSKEEVFRILDLAVEEGFYGVDTAQAYGTAEEILGEYFWEKGRSLRIVTKLPDKEYECYEDFKIATIKSIENLKVNRVDYLLLHSFNTFKRNKNLTIESLELLKTEGLIDNFGISVYHPYEVLEFIEALGGYFTVELPLNIFDQRFTSHINEWKPKGIKIIARSVFLQGLFFIEEHKLVGVFEKVKDKIKKLRELSLEKGLTLPCLCLLFAIKQPVDYIIIGVDSREQLEEIVNCTRHAPELSVDWRGMQVEDENIILPYMWTKQSKVI